MRISWLDRMCNSAFLLTAVAVPVLIGLAMVEHPLSLRTMYSRNSGPGGLERRNPLPIEHYADRDVIYSSFATTAGYKVRTIETVPRVESGRLPAVLFVQWLSCDSVEIDPRDASGWSGMIRGLVETPGFVVMRTEKPGVGDSEGPACDSLDYNTELEVHREALDRLFNDPRVDPRRIFVVGMSMGSTMAPILASERPVAGIAVWGGGAWPWLERQVCFEQRAMQLNGTPATAIQQRLPKVRRFYQMYLNGEDPRAIEASDRSLGGLWGKILVGTEGSRHFGRPLAFHRQAQSQDWLGAWRKIHVPVVVMRGQHDWYEDTRSAQLVVDTVNAGGRTIARLLVFPGLDHHFVRYASDLDAFKERNGTADPSGPILELQKFLESAATITRL